MASIYYRLPENGWWSEPSVRRVELTEKSRKRMFVAGSAVAECVSYSGPAVTRVFVIDRVNESEPNLPMVDASRRAHT